MPFSMRRAGIRQSGARHRAGVSASETDPAFGQLQAGQADPELRDCRPARRIRSYGSGFHNFAIDRIILECVSIKERAYIGLVGDPVFVPDFATPHNENAIADEHGVLYVLLNDQNRASQLSRHRPDFAQHALCQ